MSSGNDPASHDVDWAVKHFRPLLNQIDIDNFPIEPQYQTIVLSENRKYIQLGMEDCILTISRRSFKSTTDGFYTFSYKKHENQDLFFLNIYINNTLYAGNSPDLRIRRRRAVTHEFTHCLAAFFSLGRILSHKLLDGLIRELGKRAKFNMTEHYQSLLVQFGDSIPTGSTGLGIYPDEHFRLGYEDFPDSFMILYKNLILDREIFEKYFIKDLQGDFDSQVKANNIPEAAIVLGNAVAALVAAEAISADFVNMRLKEELILYYYQKAAR